TFLALTPLQTALLAILTAGTIVALYFLKLRHRRVVISSSILWRRVLDERQSHSLWEKLRRLLSIAIAITIAMLIALALARPEIDGRDSQVYFVSDGVTIHSTPSFVRRISVFESANNVGITAFEIRSIPSTPLGYEAYLEVQNFGQAAEAGITLSGTGGQRINKTVRLGTEEIYRDVFDLSQFAG